MGGTLANTSNNKIFISRTEENVGKRLKDVYNIYKRPYEMGTYINTFKGHKLDCPDKILNVKWIKKECSKEQIVSMWEELSILWKLNHPNIVKYYDVYEDAKHMYIIQEPVAAQSLSHLLEKESRTYTEFETAFIMYQLVKVIKFLHANGITHRNIKPENILIDDNGFIKLVDFELSKFHPDEKNLMKKCGFSEYTAPEVIRSSKYTKASDVWSIGVLTFFLLSGTHPFSGNKLVDSFKSSANWILTFKNSTWGNFSKESVDFIKKTLVGDINKRVTAEELVRHPWLDILREGPSEIDKEHARELKKNTSVLDRLQVPSVLGRYSSSGSTDAESEHWSSSTVLSSLRFFSCESYLRKVWLNMLVNILPKDQFGDLIQDFKSLDHDKDGKLNFDDIKKSFEEIELKWSDYEVKTILANCALEGEEYITLNEFLTATIKPTNLFDDDLIHTLFKKFDVLNISSIDEEDISRNLSRWNINISKEEIRQAIKKHDPGDLGFLTFREFKNMIIKS